MKKFLLGFMLYLAALLPANATISCSLPFTLTNGTIADANQVMANYNALVTCFTQAASAGANSDITSLSGLITPITPAQGGTNVFIGGTSTGSANAHAVATTTPNTFTLTQGYKVIFKAGFTNTGATTLDTHSTGATNVFKATPGGPKALTGGEITTNDLVEAVYDGTQYQIISIIPGLTGGFGVQTSLAAAGTTDLGTIPSHNINISGGAGPITSFGSSASNVFPIYLITISTPVTLTHNAAQLILPGTANISAAAGDTMTALYFGAGVWQVVNYQRANGTAIVNPTPLCGFNGLTMQNNSGTKTTQIDVAADSAVLIQTSGNVPFYTTAVSATLNLTVGTVTSTVNGMDGEVRPTSGWLHVYVISDGTTTGTLGSTSATSPTLPAGYKYFCRAGTFRLNATPSLLVQRVAGDWNSYFPESGGTTTAFPQIASTSAIANLTSTSVSNFVPPTATHIRIVIACQTNCTIAASSSGQTSGTTFSATNPSECFRTDTLSWYMLCDLPLNGGTAIFLGAANTGTWGISAVAYRDKVNAN